MSPNFGSKESDHFLSLADGGLQPLFEIEASEGGLMVPALDVWVVCFFERSRQNVVTGGEFVISSSEHLVETGGVLG